MRLVRRLLCRFRGHVWPERIRVPHLRRNEWFDTSEACERCGFVLHARSFITDTMEFTETPGRRFTLSLGSGRGDPTWPGGRANMDTVEFPDDRPQGEGPRTRQGEGG